MKYHKNNQYSSCSLTIDLAVFGAVIRMAPHTLIFARSYCNNSSLLFIDVPCGDNNQLLRANACHGILFVLANNVNRIEPTLSSALLCLLNIPLTPHSIQYSPPSTLTTHIFSQDTLEHRSSHSPNSFISTMSSSDSDSSSGSSAPASPQHAAASVAPVDSKLKNTKRKAESESDSDSGSDNEREEKGREEAGEEEEDVPLKKSNKKQKTEEGESNEGDIDCECKDCGTHFPFTVSEQQFYREKGFDNQPIRCAPCRRAKKDAANGGGRGGRGGMRGGRGGSGCFNCGQEGHRSFECQEPRQGGGFRGGRGGRGGSRGGRGGNAGGGGGGGECFSFKNTGNCRYGSDCRFSH